MMQHSTAPSHGSASIAGLSVRSLLLPVTLIALYFDVISGPIRFVLATARLNLLVFAPLLIGAGLFFLTVLRPTGKASLHTIVAFFFFMSAIYALIIGQPTEQVVFGLYIWSPFLIGLLYSQYTLDALGESVALLLVIACIGVFLDSYLTFPWSGASYEIFGYRSEISRDWNTFGISRVAGFARNSAVAANQISLLLIMTCLSRSTRAWLKVALYFAAVYAVYITTSKTPLFVVIVAPLLAAVATMGERLRAGRFAATTLVNVSVLAMLIALIWMPLAATGQVATVPFALFNIETLRVDSFFQRVNEMWPAAFRLLDIDGSGVGWAFGRGLGGIGAPQGLAEPALFNSADNLFVYLAVSFGSVAFIALIVPVVGSLRARVRDFRTYSRLGLLTFAAYALGTLTSVVESILPCLLLGIVFGSASWQYQLPQPTPNSGSQDEERT